MNTSGRPLDLAGYRLRVGADTVGLAGTLAPGGRAVVANHTDAAAFAALVGLPAGLVDAVQLNGGLVLPDRGGVVQVERAPAPPTAGAAVDAMPFGAFFGLAAPNANLADSTADSVALRGSLKSVQRLSYGGAMAMGAVSTDEAAAGDADPTIEPAPKDKPTGLSAVAGGRFTLHRGRKAYEVKNHLGNVLAVVSDLKVGTGPTNVQPTLVAHYLPDVLELTDYEPFGMPLANRQYQAGDRYRFGFQGQEGGDEWNGKGNMLAFKYRIHDARIGRFLSIDPLAPDYPWNSPYAFSENRVIDAGELEGMEKEIRTIKIGYENGRLMLPEVKVKYNSRWRRIDTYYGWQFVDETNGKSGILFNYEFTDQEGSTAYLSVYQPEPATLNLQGFGVRLIGAGDNEDNEFSFKAENLGPPIDVSILMAIADAMAPTKPWEFSGTAMNKHFDLPFVSLKKQFGHDVIKFKDAIRKMRFTAGLYDGTMIKFLIGLNQVFPDVVPVKKSFLYPGHSGVTAEPADPSTSSTVMPDTLFRWEDENKEPVQTISRKQFYDKRPKYNVTKTEVKKR